MKKCNADNALNTTYCVAVSSQAANVYSRFTKCFYLLKYLITVPTAINSLTQPDLLRRAQDLTAAPATQAYYEQIFSICGELTASRCNQLIMTLYTRLFL